MNSRKNREKLDFKGDDDKEMSKDASSSDEQCPICLQNITDKVVLRACKHNFCRACIEMWCKEKKECPVCRCKFKEGVCLDGFLDNMFNDEDECEEDGLMQTGVAVLGIHYYMAQRLGRLRVNSHKLNSYILMRPDVLRRSLYR